MPEPVRHPARLHWLFLFVFAAGLIAAACGGGGESKAGPTQSEPDAGFQRVRDRALGVSLDVPEDWITRYGDGSLTVQSGDEQGIVVSIRLFSAPDTETQFRDAVFLSSAAFESLEAVPIERVELGGRELFAAEFETRDVAVERHFQVRLFSATAVPAFELKVRWVSDAPPQTADLVDRLLQSVQLPAPSERTYEPWERLSSSTDLSLFAITFLDADTGIASGRSGVILRTTDGGDTWERIPTDVDATLAGAAFDRAGTTGIAVGGSGTILRTQDSGQTWHAVDSPTDRSLNGAVFVGDGATAFAVGVFGVLLRSDDAGRTWQEVGIETAESLNEVAASPDGRLLIAVGRNVRVRSEDGGESWIVGSFDIFLASVQINADGFGLASGEEGYVVRTDTAGFAWGFITQFDVPLAAAIALDAERHSFVVGSSGLIGSSTDGLAFDIEPSGIDVQLRGAAFAPDGTRFAVGDDGVILRSRAESE